MASTRDTLFNFRRDTKTPLDDWIVVATLAERDAIPAGVRHQGQQVFVEANSTNYQLVGGVENSNWAVPAGGSGQTESQVNSQINSIRTSAELLTFPNGETFAGGSGDGSSLTSETILAVLNGATGSIDADLYTDTNTQLTIDTILGILNGATGNIDGDLLTNAPNTQLTAETILGILNGATGNIDADLLTLADGGGDSNHEFEQQRKDSLGGLSFFFLPLPTILDTTSRATGLLQKETIFAGYTSRIYYFGKIPAGDSRTITGDGFENGIDSFFEAGTEDDALVFIRKLNG